jgi:hypothetical protein
MSAFTSFEAEDRRRQSAYTRRWLVASAAVHIALLLVALRSFQAPSFTSPQVEAPEAITYLDLFPAGAAPSVESPTPSLEQSPLTLLPTAAQPEMPADPGRASTSTPGSVVDMAPSSADPAAAASSSSTSTIGSALRPRDPRLLALPPTIEEVAGQRAIDQPAGNTTRDLNADFEAGMRERRQADLESRQLRLFGRGITVLGDSIATRRRGFTVGDEKYIMPSTAAGWEALQMDRLKRENALEDAQDARISAIRERADRERQGLE